MTVLQIQQQLKTYPPLDIDVLLAHTIHRSREFLYSHSEYKLNWKELLYFWYEFFNYKRGYSIAAVVGHKEFYSLDFYVNKNVLIPRPETELVVEQVLGLMNGELRGNNDNLFLIDVGTGSGCIPIAILKNLPHSTETFAIDISRPALQVAKKNAKKHNVNIEFLHGNLLQPLLKHYNLKARKLIITANLPYLTENQLRSEPSIQREPKQALIANNNGLALYEELLKQINQLLLIANCSLFILLEIDPSQTNKISALIKNILRKANLEIKKDLAGQDRLVIIRI